MAIKKHITLQLLLVGLILSFANGKGLKLGFYKKTCPRVEAIVKRTTANYISRAPSLAAPLLRMHFHDCFVRIKGPAWPVPLGRRDGRVSNASESRTLPSPAANITQLKSIFASKGLSVKDLVVLSGGHTVGTSHCSSIATQLYNFTGKEDTDPSLDSNYVTQLKSKCKPNDKTTVIGMDGSFRSFDDDYYTFVLKRRGLFQSDSALLNDKKTSAYVKRQAQSHGSKFFNDFKDSMVKMGKIGVLTGKAGSHTEKHSLSIHYDVKNLEPLRVSLKGIYMIVRDFANGKGLKLRFYKKTCPRVEAIVKRTTANYISRAPSLAAPLLRMHFHDCFVRIKGPAWPVPLGRRDGRVSNASESRTLPSPAANITQLKSMFASKGLSVKDLVVLSGGHTVGTSHCSSIATRLYNFTGKGDTDPSLDSNYVTQLKSKCKPNDKTTVIGIDGSFRSFDDDYYTFVFKRRGLFQSDSALLNDKKTSAYVKRQAQSHGSKFFNDFKDSMVKMGKIGVLTGNAGEIRKHCALIN
ncbi:hypothetical protein L1987_58188 [Smallanthus sonchifolius]|uniref:Uncharacterized protein n=1 Tax=Smallanthus sonchifolius TaxID=185202 RepID=A0ACB9DF44_9ASTR|nr:hypothetical protein L1987_58188 [Smallanthus sonchifolius]